MKMLVLQYMIFVASIYSAHGAKWALRSSFAVIQYHQTADITCNHDGNFKGFFYDGKKIKNVPGRVDIRPGEDPDTMVLEIIKVNETDYGDYTCSDGVGNATFTLEITPSIEKLESLYKLAIDFEGRVVAEVYSKPTQPIAWYKKLSDGSKVPIIKQNAKFQLEGDVKAYNIIGRGTLVINTVEKSDAGQYEILVKGVDGNKVRKETSIEVGNRPKIQTSPLKTYTITEGLSLDIACQWEGVTDTNNLIWRHNGNPVKVGGRITAITAEKLSLSSVTQGSAGNYTCSMKNDFGTTEVNTKVIVITPPNILDGFAGDVRKIPKDDMFSTTCSATGIPTPKVTIVKPSLETGGKALSVAEGVGNATLKLASVEVKDKGTYKCIASNGAKDVEGKDVVSEKNVTIDVLTKPQMFLDYTTKDDVTSAVGLKFEINCASFANPTPIGSIVHNGDEKNKSDGTAVNGVVKVTYKVHNATKGDFGVYKCVSTNDQGTVEFNVTTIEVVKASPPGGLKMLGKVPGLTYIDLRWNKTTGADLYIVYVNDTRKEVTKDNELTIGKLKRSTFYSFRVASKNIAGIGNKSVAVIIKTSDITRPGPASEFKTKDVTSVTATISWTPPIVENQDLLTFRVQYCKTDGNGTLIQSECHVRNERKDRSIELDNLERGTKYKVTIIAYNQAIEGEAASFEFETKNTTPPPPKKSGISSGLSSGALVGIIIAVILIILIVIDLFCCFFNNCGFSHCFYNTFCAAKGKKYAPADTKEEEELKPKNPDNPDV